MSKYRVHIFEEVRRAFEVEADSPHEAMERVRDNWPAMSATQVEDTGEITDFIVIDPLLPDGEVDYENVIQVEGPSISRLPGAPYYPEDLMTKEQEYDAMEDFLLSIGAVTKDQLEFWSRKS